MKAFFTTIFVIGCLSGVVLCQSFKYPLAQALYHLLALAILCVVVGAGILFIKFFLTSHRAAYTCANGLALLFWLFICFFYPIILGSNFFWGATITFDILQKYLASFDAALSVLPVQKWILVSGLLLYIAIVLTIFYFIRIRKSFFITQTSPANRFARRRAFLIISLVLLGLIFLFRNPIMNLKRSMHFRKEPLIYFALGPMWGANWSDEGMFKNKALHSSPQELVCIKSVKPSPQASRPVVVILLDALRSDHLSVYGYDRQTSPFLDSLYKADKIIRVKNSFSTSTNTTGGIVSLFYSKDWGDFGYEDLTLMKYFRLSGYTTSAILTGYHSGWYGLSTLYRQDCDMFFESTADYNTATDDDLVTLKKIETVVFQKRSFTFIHLLSTHGIGKKNQEFRIFQPDKLGIGSNKKAVLTNNYDNGVLQGDYVIRRIFQKLQTDGVLDSAIVIITGDHGEMLGENGKFGHGEDIHEKVIEVPILIYDNDHAWYRNTAIATVKDLAPTITDRVFGNIPACWQGRSLHDSLTSFSTKIITPNKAELPMGDLSYRNDSLVLDIFNNEGILKKRLFKDSVWRQLVPVL